MQLVVVALNIDVTSEVLRNFTHFNFLLLVLQYARSTATIDVKAYVLSVFSLRLQTVALNLGIRYVATWLRGSSAKGLCLCYIVVHSSSAI